MFIPGGLVGGGAIEKLEKPLVLGFGVCPKLEFRCICPIVVDEFSGGDIGEFAFLLAADQSTEVPPVRCC